MSQTEIDRCPINSIPLDISGVILIHAASSIDTACGYQEFLKTVSSISRTWRQLALSTQQLWAKIAVSLITRPSKIYIESCLARSGSLKLDILLSVDDEPLENVEKGDIESKYSQEIMGLLMAHVKRWRELTICTAHCMSLRAALQPLEGFATALEYISLNHCFETSLDAGTSIFPPKFATPVLSNFLSCYQLDIPSDINERFPALEYLQWHGPREVLQWKELLDFDMYPKHGHQTVRELQLHAVMIAMRGQIEYPALTKLCFSSIDFDSVWEFLKDVVLPRLAVLRMEHVDFSEKANHLPLSGDTALSSRFPYLSTLEMIDILGNPGHLESVSRLEHVLGPLDFCQSLVVSSRQHMNWIVRSLGRSVDGVLECPILTRLELDYMLKPPDMSILRDLVRTRTVGDGASGSGPNVALKELHVKAPRAISDSEKRELESYLDAFEWSESGYSSSQCTIRNYTGTSAAPYTEEFLDWVLEVEMAIAGGI